jgi:multidrug efflux system membrane fusion protein
MHGEIPNNFFAKRGSKRRMLAIAIILIAIVAALYYVFGGPAAQAAARGPFRRRRPGSNPGRPGDARQRARLPRCRRHDQSAQYRYCAPASGWQLLSVNSRKATTSRRRRAGQNRPVIYQAQLDQAVAKKAQDEAQLANSKIDLERYENSLPPPQ